MNLQEKIYQSKNDYNILFEDLKKIRADMNESKKNIGQLLSNITSKGKWLIDGLKINIIVYNRS